MFYLPFRSYVDLISAILHTGSPPWRFPALSFFCAQLHLRPSEARSNHAARYSDSPPSWPSAERNFDLLNCGCCELLYCHGQVDITSLIPGKRRIKTSITFWDLIESSRIQTEPEKAHFHPSYLTIEEHSIIRHGQHQRSRRPPDTRTRRILMDCRYTCEVVPRSAAPPFVFGIHKHHDPSSIGRIMARPVAGFHILTRAARWCYTWCLQLYATSADARWYQVRSSFWYQTVTYRVEKAFQWNNGMQCKHRPLALRRIGKRSKRSTGVSDNWEMGN